MIQTDIFKVSWKTLRKNNTKRLELGVRSHSIALRPSAATLRRRLKAPMILPDVLSTKCTSSVIIRARQTPISANCGSSHYHTKWFRPSSLPLVNADNWQLTCDQRDQKLKRIRRLDLLPALADLLFCDYLILDSLKSRIRFVLLSIVNSFLILRTYCTYVVWK